MAHNVSMNAVGNNFPDMDDADETFSVQSSHSSAHNDSNHHQSLLLEAFPLIPEGAPRIKAKDMLFEERKHIEKFTKLRSKMGYWHFEPAADRMMPLFEQEARAIPRPGSPVVYDVGSHQYKVLEEEKKRLREVFVNFDMDGSESIDVRELRSIFKSLEVDADKDQLELLMRDYDEDGSGEIQFDEFVPLYLEVVEGQQTTNYASLDRKTDIDEGSEVFAKDSLERIRPAKLISVITKPGTPAKSEDGTEPPLPKPNLMYVVEFAGGEREQVTRKAIYTRSELNPPQSSIKLEDILPPTRDVLPPTFNELQQKGVAVSDMRQYVHFTYRHAYGINQTLPVLRQFSYPTKSVLLSKEDVDALVQEDWQYLHTNLHETLHKLIEQASDSDLPYGALVRIATRVPIDQPVNSICVLSQSQKRVSEADSDVLQFVTRQRRGLPLPYKLAVRHGLKPGHVPTRKDVAAVRKLFKTVHQQATDLQREVGKRRLQKYMRAPKDPAAEVKELEHERDRLLEEFAFKIDLEKERLSLIDQMHSGPEQTDAKKHAKAQLKYLQSSVQDAKEVFQKRIQAAMEHDPELEEGTLAMEAETEDIERLLVFIMRDFEQGVQSEIRFREMITRKIGIQSVIKKRMSKMAVLTKKLTEEEVYEFANVIQKAWRCRRSRHQYLQAANLWTFNKGNVLMRGPVLPLTQNFVLARGVPIFGFYSGFSVTTEIEGGGLETRTISKYSDRREVKVRVPFSAPPLVGGRFALLPPDHLVSLQAMLLDAFVMQKQDEGGVDASQLRSALATNGYIFSDPETDKLVDVYGQGEAGFVDFPEYRKLLTGPEFKEKARLTFAASKELDAIHVFLRAVNTQINEHEEDWDGISQDEETRVRAGLSLFEVDASHIDFFGGKPAIKTREMYLKEMNTIMKEYDDDEDEPEDAVVERLQSDERMLSTNSPEALLDEIMTLAGEMPSSEEPSELDPKEQFRKKLLASSPAHGSFFVRDIAKPPVTGTRNFGSFVGRSPLLNPADKKAVMASPVGTFVNRSRQVKMASPIQHSGDESPGSPGSPWLPGSRQSPSPRRRGSPGSPLRSSRSLQNAPPMPAMSPVSAQRSSLHRIWSPTRGLNASLDNTPLLRAATPQQKSDKRVALTGFLESEAGASGAPATGAGVRRVAAVRRLQSNSLLLSEMEARMPASHPATFQDKPMSSWESQDGADRVADDNQDGDDGPQVHMLDDHGFSPASSPSTQPQRVQIAGEFFGGSLVAAAMDRLRSVLPGGSGNEVGREMDDATDKKKRTRLMQRKRVNVALEGSFIKQDQARRTGRRASLMVADHGHNAKDEDRHHHGPAAKVLLGEESDPGNTAFAALGKKRRASFMSHTIDITWPYFGVMQDWAGEVTRLQPFLANSEIRNIDDVSGKIAVAESGECSLVVKARYAQNAGATAVIILCKHEDIYLELKQNARLAAEQRIEHPEAPYYQRPYRKKNKAVNQYKFNMAGGPERKKMANRTDLAFIEEENNVPDLERRSAIRIPVVLVEKQEGWRFTTGSKVDFCLYDRNLSYPLPMWPHTPTTEALVDYYVRNDYTCMSNILLRVMHMASMKLLPVGIKPEDPVTWSQEQLLAALMQVNWVPRAHLEYSLGDLVRLAKQMKCKPPEQQSKIIFKVSVLEAQHLPMLNVQVKSASFVKAIFNEVEKRTKTIKDHQDPVWKDDFKFDLYEDDIRKNNLMRVKALFDEVSGEEAAVDLEGLGKVIRSYPNNVARDEESLLETLNKYDANKNGVLEWEEMVTLFDETAIDIKDLFLTVYDEAIGGLQHPVGTVKVTVEGLRSGERRSLTLTLKDKDGLVVLGHDGRTTLLKIRISMHNVSSVREFEDPEKEALRIIVGSDRVKKDLQSCQLLGTNAYPMYLSVTAFDPSIAQNPHREFRAFVYDSMMTAITQRYGNMYFQELTDPDYRQTIKYAILQDFYSDILMEMEDATFFNYILDVFVPPQTYRDEPIKIMVLSVKPFHESTDAILYDWDDPDDKGILYNGAIFPEGEEQQVTLASGQSVSNVEVRYVANPRIDPLSVLPSLWADSLNDVLTGMGLEDPTLDAGRELQLDQDDGVQSGTTAGTASALSSRPAGGGFPNADSKTCCIL